MLNPLKLKSSERSGLERSKMAAMRETENEIYCQLCREKLSIELYRAHIHCHRRPQKSNIATYYLPHPREPEEPQLPAREIQQSTIFKLDDSSHSHPNPQRSDQKSSFIYNLVSEKDIVTESRKITQFDPARSPFRTERAQNIDGSLLELSQASQEEIKERSSHRVMPRNILAQAEE